MQSQSWSLIEEKWLPCLMTSGRTAKLSLRELYLNLEVVQDLQMRDYEKLAVMRFLLALNTRILSPITQDTWIDFLSQPNLVREKAEAYFNQPEIAPLYDLLHPDRPFMQTSMNTDKNGKAKEWWTLNTLSHYYTSGLAPIVASQTLDSQFPKVHISDVPVMLITGVLGHLTIWVNEIFNASMMLRGSNVFAFLKGANFHETLLLNTLYYDDDSDTAPMPTDFNNDNLSWELSDNPLWRNQQSSYYPFKGFLHYMTYQSLAVRFQWETDENGEMHATKCMLFPVGLPIQSLSESSSVFDPYVNWKINDKGHRYPAASIEDKHFWKHLGSWLASSGKSDASYQVFQSFSRVGEFREILTDIGIDKVNVLCIGVGTDKNNKKVADIYSSELPLRLSVISDSKNISQLTKFIDLSIFCGSQLRFMLKTIYPKRGKNPNRNPKPEFIMDEYWASVKRKVHSYASHEAFDIRVGIVFLVKNALRAINQIGTFVSLEHKKTYFKSKRAAKVSILAEMKKAKEFADSFQEMA